MVEEHGDTGRRAADWAGSSKPTFDCIRTIGRPSKPRSAGLTYARDSTRGIRELEDLLESAADYIDILKFPGFVPRLVPRDVLARKVALCEQYGVVCGLGGALLEIALLQGGRAVDDLLASAKELGIGCIEVCRQIAIVPTDDLVELVHVVQDHGLRALAEAGVAYGISERDEVDVDEGRVIDTLHRLHEAGAWRLVLESEGLTESRRREDQRWDVVQRIVNDVGPANIILEADDPEVWARHIRAYGPEVNLFVDSSRVLTVEGARRGGWSQPAYLINRVARLHGE